MHAGVGIRLVAGGRAVNSGLRRVTGVVSSAVLVLASCLGVFVAAAPAQAADLQDASQLQQRQPGLGVTADPLPTVQLDGSSSIVWAQDIIGDTVYAGGSFANVRPAGAAPGTNLTARGNLLAYDITTGQLKTGWAPRVNGTVKAIEASPDGSRIYVGGSFTLANDTTRWNLAAFDAKTGALISGFNAAVGGSYVNAIVATNSVVYVGGLIGAGNGVTRKNFVAFDTSGALLGWAPTSDLQVDSMVMDPSGTKLIAAGRFGTVNGVLQRGLVALDPVTGATMPWAAANVVKNGVPQGQPSAGNAGIYSLTADANAVYGTGWVYADTTVGNLEGTFAAAKGTGDIVWIADCHGDHYGVFSDGSAVYTTSHEHACETIGAMRQGSGSPGNMRNATAVTAARQGTLQRPEVVSSIYADWSGYGAPAAINWYPEWLGGTASGQGQAGWSITGNSQYISVGGEFIGLNNQTQQGLVRFAKQPASGARQGPKLSGDAWVPTAKSARSGAISVSIPSNWDQDDRDLTYQFRRTDQQQPFATLVRAATYWHQPMVQATDTNVAAGQTYTYQVRAVDGDGNAVSSATVNATASSVAQSSAYARRIMDDVPQLYWRLGSTGSVVDQMGAYPGTVGTGVTNTAGAVNGDTNQGSAFNGTSNGLVRSNAIVPLTTDVSIELWFKTASTTGGKLAGYGSSATGSSGTYDRNVYMSNDGRLSYSVLFGAQRTITTTDKFNDNRWHHLVVAQGMAGTKLYVDGQVKASNGGIRYARTFNGYWRVGGDNLGTLPNRGTNQWFTGSIDEFAVYPYVLDPTKVSQHKDAGQGVSSPAADFSSSSSGLTASFDGTSSTVAAGRTVASYAWDFGDGTPTVGGATPSHSYAAEGTYPVTLTVTDSSGSSGSVTKQVQVTAPATPPVAQISSSASGLKVNFDGSGSSATSPATVTGYAWKFGDGGTASGVSPSHVYAAAGTYTVTLTVTDSRGESSSTTASVTVAHADPVASFSSSSDGLKVSVDGSDSSAADGASVSSYAWSWGDGASDSGATANHTYAQAGTYNVKLTVTDSLGASGTSTRQVTVFTVTPKAADAFSRTVASGWGTADIGGDWSGTAGLSVAGGQGRITSGAADTRTTTLPVSVGDAVHEFSVSSDKVANGGLHVNYLMHRSGSGEYRLKLRYAASGTVNVSLARLVGSTETLLADRVVSGYTHTPGGTLLVKVETVTAGGSTTLRTKVWVQGTAEPSAWSLTASDSTAGLQDAGQIGFSTYTGGSTTNGPITVLIDDLRVN
jgi:PKD repeat protein